MPSDELGRHKAFLLFDLWTAEDISLCPFYGVREYFGLPDYINFLLARIADGSLRWDSSIGSAKMRDFLYKQSYISGIFSYLAVTFHKVQLFCCPIHFFS